jgi:two-component system OmpR family response regulator
MNETSPIRVLLVDDEPACASLADYLVRQGFAVTQAGTAAEARSRLVEAAFDSCCSIS